MRDFQQPRRSCAFSTRGMAATSHPLATLAAVETLKSGGNAVDAAVSAVAVQCVVEPQMTAIGGDCFAILGLPDGRLKGLNGSGRSAAALTLDRAHEVDPLAIPEDHGLAVTVPGCVDAWATLLAEHGTMGLDRALRPAIDVADAGFPIFPRVARDWAGEVEKLKRDEGARRHYLKADGTAPAAGDVMAMPALAATLRRIAEHGPDGFYKGEVAEDIVAAVGKRGGLLSLDDLAAVESEWVEPVRRRYRDVEVVEMPPATQGMIALLMLSILERFDMKRLDPLGAERFHLEMEAARLAYAVRDRVLCDPETADCTVDQVLDAAFVDGLAARIDPARRLSDVGPVHPSGTDTVYLTVVDENRMAVSFINSVFSEFGSGIVAPQSGVVLQNRGAGFVTTEGHPNVAGPRKRPLHTLIPGMILREGRPWASFGVMGGQYQACGHAHVVGNMIDYGMDPQAAIDFPRAFFKGDVTEPETTVPAATLQGLRERGHDVVPSDGPHGGGQAIVIDEARGVLIGGSDPRKDGCALGL